MNKLRLPLYLLISPFILIFACDFAQNSTGNIDEINLCYETDSLGEKLFYKNFFAKNTYTGPSLISKDQYLFIEFYENGRLNGSRFIVDLTSSDTIQIEQYAEGKCFEKKQLDKNGEMTSVYKLVKNKNVNYYDSILIVNAINSEYHDSDKYNINTITAYQLSLFLNFINSGFGSESVFTILSKEDGEDLIRKKITTTYLVEFEVNMTRKAIVQLDFIGKSLIRFKPIKLELGKELVELDSYILDILNTEKKDLSLIDNRYRNALQESIFFYKKELGTYYPQYNISHEYSFNDRLILLLRVKGENRIMLQPYNELPEYLFYFEITNSCQFLNSGYKIIQRRYKFFPSFYKY